MHKRSGARSRVLLQWSGAIVALTALFILVLTTAGPPEARLDEIRNPLAPPATESPRVTFSSFHHEIGETERLVKEAYKLHVAEQGWFQSEATAKRVEIIKFHLDRAIRCLDLSEVPPGNRAKIAMETAMLLEEIFDRVGVPPLDSIPDAAAMKARTAAGERPSWTVPNTEIRIARVESGPRAGEYLFTPDSVSRAYEFYQKVRNQPSKNNFDFYSFYALSPGDWMPPKWYTLIQRLPDWFHEVHIDSAHWQWGALIITLLLALSFCVVAFRATRRGGFVAKRLPQWTLGILLPAATLVGALVVQWWVGVLNFTGPVQRMLDMLFEVAIYLNFTWLVVVCFNALSDWAAHVWSAQHRSFDAGVLRVGVRVIGIVIAIALLVYGASQIGVPLVGILAGLGVGGLAVALAAQPTMENLIGGLMIYADRPVRVGDFCKFGDMSGVIEEIGVRSTRIRGADRSVTSIPNGEFSKLRLTNHSRRDRLLFNTTIGINYDANSDQLRKIMQGIRDMLTAHPKVNRASAKVNLAAFGSSAMELEVSTELAAVEGHELASVREDLLFKMFAIVETVGAKMVGR